MPLPEIVDIAHKHLFSTKDEMDKDKLPVSIQGHMERLRSVYAYWESNPSLKDRDIVKHIIKRYDLSDAKARQDLRLIKTLLGDLHKSSKDFHRYRFQLMIEKAFDAAEKKNSVKDMIAAASSYAKYMKLDQDDEHDPDWSMAIQMQLKFTDDISVMGIKPLPDIQERIKRLKKEFDDPEIEDISFEEIDNNPDTLFSLPPK